MMSELKFSVLHSEPDEAGWIVSTVPILPGCVSQGMNRKEALDNAREAIELYVETLRDQGEVIPKELGWEEVRLIA